MRRLEREGQPAVVYLHPYELDPAELSEVPHVMPLKTRVTQGLNRRWVQGRLSRLMRDFRFGRVVDVIRESDERAAVSSQQAFAATH